MKESAGELNMTVVTVVLVGILLVLGLAFKDTLSEWVTGIFEQQTQHTDINVAP